MSNWQDLHQKAINAARAGEVDMAEGYWMQSYQILQTLNQRGESLIGVLDGLFRLYARNKRFDEAEKMIRELIEVGTERFTEKSPTVANAMIDLAKLLLAMGHDQEGIKAYEKAYKLCEHAYGVHHIETARCLHQFAKLQMELSDPKRGEYNLRRALGLYEKNVRHDDPDLARIYNNMANACMKNRKFEEAERFYLKEFEIWRSSTSSKKPDIANGLNDLAEFYLTTNKVEKAIRAAQRAMQISEDSDGKPQIQAARAQRILGVISLKVEDLDSAQDYLELSIENYQDFYSSDHPIVQEVWGHLALCLSKKKRR